MVNPRTPDEVVTLLSQGDAAIRQVNPEHAFHEQHHGGALIVGRPLSALVAERVDPPLDFHVLA
jgi:hypothetical protein